MGLHSLSIVLGYACTFKCRHCAIIGATQQQLSADEISVIAESICRYRYENLIFVGGEPTLYISSINKILSSADCRSCVIITTNGSFAVTPDIAIQTLQQVAGLNEVQLSYDKYHNEFFSQSNAANLKKACEHLGLRFSVIVTIQSPLDLVLLTQLRKLGEFPIGIQKVIPFGAAKQNGISYTYPSFDREVLLRCCPNKDNMVYMCGRGFSVCDIPREGFEKAFFPTVGQLRDSRFYRNITTSTFGVMAKMAGLNVSELSPAHSCPCVLCEELSSGLAGVLL
jgi:MoaA/NifB/PqqE/SkfB family radical SAM enzyme